MATVLPGSQPNPLGMAMGQGMADQIAQAHLQKQFGHFLTGMGGQGLSAQPAPPNIDALRKISDPRVMQMAAQMLMQQAYQRNRTQAGGAFGLMPGEYQFLTPEERRQATLKKHFGADQTNDKLMEDIAKAQRVIDAGTETVEEKVINPKTNMEEVKEVRRVKAGQEQAVAAAKKRIAQLTKPPASQEAAKARAILPEMMAMQKDVQKMVGRTKRLANFTKKAFKLPKDKQKGLALYYQRAADKKKALEEIVSAVENE